MHAENHSSPGPPRPVLERAGRITLWLLAGAAVLAFLLYAVRWSMTPTHGFAAYYTYGRIVLGDEPFARAYGQPFFDSAMAAGGLSEIRDVPYNVPTNAFVMLPVAWLTPRAAKAVWTFLLVALYALAVALLLRLNGIPPGSNLGLMLIFYAFMFRPAYENIAWGQIYLALLPVFVGMLALWRRGRPQGAAMLLAAPILAKGYGFVLLLWRLLKGEWRPVLFCLGLVGAALLVTLPLFGSGSWQAWAERIREAQPGNPAYQTIPGVIIRYVGGGPGTALLLGLGIAFVGIGLLRLRQDDQLMEAGTILGLNVVTAPMAESYHYVLFLPLVFTLAGRMSNRVLLAAPAILLAMPLAAPGGAPVEYLAYGRLAAGIALMGLVLYVDRVSSQASR